LGSIPFGYLVGRLQGKDIRQYGSGNIGATNALRVLGPVAGLIVSLGDGGKGILAVLLARSVTGSTEVVLTAGLLVIVGHIFSVFLGFKGGKGVATSAGVALMLFPLILFEALLVWLITVFLTRYVSLGSMLAVLSVPLFMLLHNFPSIYVIFSLIVAFLVIFRHRSNIIRLLQGTESKISLKGKNR